MQTDGIPIEHGVNTRIMAFVKSINQVVPEDIGDVDRNALRKGLPWIEINKRMESNSDKIDHYQDFFLANEQDFEDSTPAPTPKGSSSAAMQTCGAQSMKPRFEHQPGKQKTTCGVPLKRKKFWEGWSLLEA